MGISYTNITLKNVDQRTVADYLQRSKRQAFIAPTVNRCTVVFDKESDEDESSLQHLAGELSEAFRSVAFAVLVHDGDVFLYWLYENGRLLDHYNSIPSYLEPTESNLPEGGNPKELCRALQEPQAMDDLQDIFARVVRTATEDDWAQDHLTGEEIHDVLAQAMGLPLFAVETGDYSVINDSLPKDLGFESMIFCGGDRE